jgi:hypothetical protein
VIIITTPGGFPATFDPFAPQPGIVDPAAQTATAAVLFGFVTPADPFAQTATAQALFGIPPADPFAQTATAQALFGYPPPVDPFAQTATAQALFGIPPAEPFAQTATAQALIGAEAPQITPQPEAVAILPPGVVITVTATPEPLATHSPAQRPIKLLTPSMSNAGELFRAVLGGATAALALLGVLGGAVLFLLLAGVLAGVSLGNPGPPKYQLSERPPRDIDPHVKPTVTPSPPPVADEEWPDSLP